MSTAVNFGSMAFLAGSTIEGGAYARHLAQQRMQDLDFMLVEGNITSPECLLKLDNAVIFVQVKYDENFIEQHMKTPLFTARNRHGVLCVDGFKMKEKYCGIDTSSIFPAVTTTATGVTSSSSASTEVKFHTVRQTSSLGEQFEIMLNFIRRMQAQENVEQYQPSYRSFSHVFRRSISQAALPLLGLLVDAERLQADKFQDGLSLTSPMYHIQMPQVNQVRASMVLGFYEKYKHLGQKSTFQNYIDYLCLSMDFESDFVPAFQLEFWPEEIQPFLHRIEGNRPDLHKIICEQTSMHLIPKWSGKTPNIDEVLEFRYSFSAIERLLAQNRTRAEQILNGVARSIYYRYLKGERCVEDEEKKILPSFFIKTTVLWMCETYNLNEQFSETEEDQTIAYAMATKWLEYTKSLLRSGQCPHYFIESYSLLEACSPASLFHVIDILENKVNLYEHVKINVLIEYDEMMVKQRQTTEDWFKKMKVSDIIAAIGDYRQLRESWLQPSDNGGELGDAVDCLYTLNQLRALDGEKQENWAVYKRLFLPDDQSTWAESIWDENVAECSVCDFVDNLVAVSSMIQQIINGIEKTNFEQNLTENMERIQPFSFQNIVNDLIQPTGMLRSGMMITWLPMFTTPYFNVDSVNVSSMQQRSVLDNHPIGPLQSILQDRPCPTPLNPQDQQAYQQHAQSASDRFLNLLKDCPNPDWTINDLLKHHEPTPKIPEEDPISCIRTTNTSPINKESSALLILDPDSTFDDITDDMLRTMNDYVLLYTGKSSLIKYARSINTESIFVILCGSALDASFLSQLQNLNQICSIFIYSVQEQPTVEELQRQYPKLVGVFQDQRILREQVRISIEQPFAMRFGFYNPQQVLTSYTMLSKDNALFFWNLLLKRSLSNIQSDNQGTMIQVYREYYSQNAIEMKNIDQFRSTYHSVDAHQWFSRRNFVSKLLIKAFHTANIELLKLFHFFIDDLCSMMTERSTMAILYYTTNIENSQMERFVEHVGQLMSFSGFILVCSSPENIVACRTGTHMTVRFEIINVSEALVYLIDSTTFIFNLGSVFQVDSLNYDDQLGMWRICLIFKNDGADISQHYVAAEQETMDRMALPIIMGQLLMDMNDSLATRNYFDNLKDQDQALIHRFYGIIHYKKGEYALALENFQIAYELMVTDERIRDSASILHQIGNVYDMTKEFDKALENHRQALKIRQTFCPGNDVRLGISLYSIGRTLVNMHRNCEALDYHQQALSIWEQTLTYSHRYLVQSLHSHGVVYSNIGDYTQAFHYFTRALEMYEMLIPRDEDGIIMVTNALKRIQEKVV